MSLWFIADHHFGHANIIQYENRPFANVSEMNGEMIKKWNKAIAKYEKVYVLGDFSFHNKALTEHIVEQLNGYKVLVMGNHDKARSARWWLDVGFDEVYAHPVLLDGKYILSHEPHKIDGYVNIFGHVHSHPLFADYTEQSFCVSAERIGYTPINLKDIKKAVERRPDQTLARQAL